MRRAVGILGASLVLIGSANAAQLKSETDKLSYAMGLETGRAFRSHSIKVRPKIYARGLQDGLRGRQPLLSAVEVKKVLTDFQKRNFEQMQSQLRQQADKNQQAGDAFLQKNKSLPGVIALPSGLQYKVITKGKGAVPTINDNVIVNYEGRLLSGKVFDSSYRRGKPITLPLSGVIKGWQEALTKMHTGATWELYIPAGLAYGKQGAPGSIGPNETLIFKVELIGIKK